MRKVKTAAILICLMAVMAPFTALAKDKTTAISGTNSNSSAQPQMEITLIVPESHTLHVETEGLGHLEIKVGEQNYSISSSTDIKIPTTQGLELKAVSDKNYSLKSITYNGEEMAVKNNTYTIEKMDTDGILKAVFMKKAATNSTTTNDTTSKWAAAKTGDYFQSLFYFNMLVIAGISGVYLICKKARNKMFKK